MSSSRRLFLWGILWAGACGPSGPDRLDQLFSGDLTVVDLTHSLSATMPYWPNASGNPFVHDTLARHADGAPIMATYRTPEHHGTHLDAPVHGGEGQRSVDLLTAADLFGPAIVIDIAERAVADPNYLVTAADIVEWEASHGAIPAGAIVVLSTGWSKKWERPREYFPHDGEGRLQFPGFSVEAARLLTDERTIRGVGTDAPSIDYGPSRDFVSHGVINGSGKFHLENMANVHELPPTGVNLIVAPIKIEGGSGGQVRIFAIMP